MDEPQFWRIIESGGPKALEDPQRQLVAVHKTLAKLLPAEVRDFHSLFNEKLTAAYTWDL